MSPPGSRGANLVGRFPVPPGLPWPLASPLGPADFEIHRAAGMLILPSHLPGVAPGSLIDQAECVQNAEAGHAELAFSSMLLARPWPVSLAQDDNRRQRFMGAVLSCVEGLYRDRLAPSLGAVCGRLRKGGWPSCETLSGVLPLCASLPETYELLPPRDGEPAQILLRRQPRWFQGWVDPDALEDGDSYPSTVWEALRTFLQKGDCNLRELKGDASHAASCLFHLSHALPSSLKNLSLGELQHIIKLALGPSKEILAYDAQHGGRILPCGTKPKVAQEASPDDVKQSGARGTKQAKDKENQPPFEDLSCIGVDSACLRSKSFAKGDMGSNQPHHMLATKDQDVEPQPLTPRNSGKHHAEAPLALVESLRARRLPGSFHEAWLGHYKQSVHACVESLYKDRLEPTLGELQQRLRTQGWNSEQVHSIPLICARMPEVLKIIAPGDGEPMRIWLKTPPHWFEGWVSTGSAGADAYPKEMWHVLKDFFEGNGGLMFKDGVNGAAQELTSYALPYLKDLSLGELRDVVKYAVTSKGLLAYEGDKLRPVKEVQAKINEETVVQHEHDRRIFSSI